MLAMVLDHNADVVTSPLKLRELSEPAPGAGEVRLKVNCCAVCRTDLHVIEGELPPARLPVIPGHQFVGVVDELGSDITRFAKGDRVGVAWLRNTCGQCEYCRAGRENLCESSRYTGYHADGGYATSAVVPADYAYAIPPGLTDTQAAPLLCSGIIGYAALRRSNLRDGGSIALYGFGSSAHIVLQVAKHRGCTVYVVTRAAEHRQLARDMGAHWVGENPSDLPAKTDSAILFAPVGTLVPPAMEHLKKGGTLAVAGIYLSPVPELDYSRHLFYERDLRSVTANTRSDGEGLLAEAAAIPIHPHVTTYPLARANEALIDLKSDRINGTAVLLMEA